MASDLGERLPPFGALVKALREDAHLTQSDLAALMGLSENGGRVTVAYWETEQRRPSEDQMPKLAACLGYWPVAGDPTLRRLIVAAALDVSLMATSGSYARDGLGGVGAETGGPGSTGGEP